MSFDLPMLSRTLDEFVKLGMWTEALEVISSFETQLLNVSETVGTSPATFVNFDSRAHQTDVQRRVAKLYQTAMIACGDAGKHHLVVDLYRRLSHYLYRAQKPTRRRKRRPADEILRDAFSYPAMIRICAQAEYGARGDEAEWWFQEMLRVGVLPTLLSTRFMLQACENDITATAAAPAAAGSDVGVNYSNYDAAERWFAVGRQLVQRGCDAPLESASECTLEDSSRKPREARKRHREMSEWMHGVRNLYNTMIRCCAKAPGGARLERAEELFAELCALETVDRWPGDGSENGSENGRENGRENGSDSNNRKNNKLLPTAHTFADMILACARLEGGSDMARATELYRQHTKLAAHVKGHMHYQGPKFIGSFQTTPEILINMIECCRKSTAMKKEGKMRQSLNFYRELHNDNFRLGRNKRRWLTPTVQVYNNLLWCCAQNPVRASDLAWAEQLFKKMTAGVENKPADKGGLLPLTPDGGDGGGYGILSDDRTCSLRPNVDTYNALLTACANVTSEQGGAHKRKAEMYYAIMKSEGDLIVPNRLTFEAMLLAEQRSLWPSEEKIETWQKELDKELAWYNSATHDALEGGGDDDGMTEEEIGVGMSGVAFEEVDDGELAHSAAGLDWDHDI